MHRGVGRWAGFLSSRGTTLASCLSPQTPFSLLSIPPFPTTHSVGRYKRPLAEMCVEAVLTVADLERKDVNLDLIKVW